MYADAELRVQGGCGVTCMQMLSFGCKEAAA